MSKELENKHLSKGQEYFARVVIICVDCLKIPLIDILRSFIKPKNLCEEVKKCEQLMRILNSEQKEKCGLNSKKPYSSSPDYWSFDVTLLSTLIQHCTDVPSEYRKLWNAVKKIKKLRNNIFHSSYAYFTKEEFNDHWISMMTALENCQKLMKSMKYYSDYKVDVLKHRKVEPKEYKSCIKTLKGKFLLHNQMHF